MLSSLWLLALTLVLLIVASALFSSAETALTAVSDARMRQLANQGSKRAKVVEKLRADREGLIGSILIGNNAVNVLGSALATSFAIALFGEGGLVLATIGMTVLLVVFAEVMPKTYALKYADSYALRIAPILQVVVRVLSPLSVGINLLTTQIIRPNPDSNETHEEELRGLIELQGRDGNAYERERIAMLSSILDLNHISVEAIMTHRAAVSIINADDQPEDILRYVLNSPHTRHPVFSGKSDNIVGVLHAKDLLRAVGKAETVMILPEAVQNIASDAYFIPETTLLFDQLQAFRSRREHFSVVVDEYGDFRGIVTLEDILEEIVGDIDDEHDIDIAGLTQQMDGSWLVDGNITVRDLNRALGWHLPDKDAATVAGLVLFESRTIPSSDQEFYFHGTWFRIVKRRGNSIKTIKVSKTKN
ncbi:HlyC/CorC family transporter [bacterium]|nr:HlyC/CorC family transporter [bacterium]